jgi:hypothetical protein
LIRRDTAGSNTERRGCLSEVVLLPGGNLEGWSEFVPALRRVSGRVRGAVDRAPSDRVVIRTHEVGDGRRLLEVEADTFWWPGEWRHF